MMRKLLFCASLLVLPAVGQAEVLPLNRTDASVHTVGALQFRGAVTIPPGKGKFGGLSALAVLEENKELLAVSDVSRAFRLTLTWDQQGQLIAAVPDKGAALLDDTGKPPKTRARFDSESLTRWEDGWLVGYERTHRIMHFSDGPAGLQQVPVAWPAVPEWSALPSNLGFEALVNLGQGRLLAIAEASTDGTTHPAWLWQDGHWSDLTYRSALTMVPSDATLLPDGDLLVLERGFNLFFNFQSRLVRVKADQIKPGQLLEGEEIARLASPLITENFEALAAGRAPDGAIRLYIASDNNFNAAQQTILAVFDLISPPSSLR